MTKKFAFCIPAILLVSAIAHAQQIINIDNRLTTNANKLSITLDPGDYTLSPISPADGGQFYARHHHVGLLENCGPDGLCGGWGWEWTYIISSPSIGLQHVDIRQPNGFPVRYASPEIAFDLGAIPFSFTLTETEMIQLWEEDCCYGDNLGGVSLLLERGAAIPEPTSLCILTFGAVTAYCVRRCRISLSPIRR